MKIYVMYEMEFKRGSAFPEEEARSVIERAILDRFEGTWHARVENDDGQYAEYECTSAVVQRP